MLVLFSSGPLLLYRDYLRAIEIVFRRSHDCEKHQP
jgi:hypothetical protein